MLTRLQIETLVLTVQAADTLAEKGQASKGREELRRGLDHAKAAVPAGWPGSDALVAAWCEAMERYEARWHRDQTPS